MLELITAEIFGIAVIFFMFVLSDHTFSTPFLEYSIFMTSLLAKVYLRVSFRNDRRLYFKYVVFYKAAMVNYPMF